MSKPVPTIFDPEESHLSVESKHVKSHVFVPRKLPTKRVYQGDQFNLFEEQDKVRSFNDIDSMLTSLGYTFQKYDNHAIFYHVETNALNVSIVTDRVRVD